MARTNPLQKRHPRICYMTAVACNLYSIQQDVSSYCTFTITSSLGMPLKLHIVWRCVDNDACRLKQKIPYQRQAESSNCLIGYLTSGCRNGNIGTALHFLEETRSNGVMYTASRLVQGFLEMCNVVPMFIGFGVSAISRRNRSPDILCSVHCW